MTGQPQVIIVGIPPKVQVAHQLIAMFNHIRIGPVGIPDFKGCGRELSNRELLTEGAALQKLTEYLQEEGYGNEVHQEVPPEDPPALTAAIPSEP